MVNSGSEPMSHGFNTDGALSWAEAGEVDHCSWSLSVYHTNLTIALLFLKDICTGTPHKSKPKHNYNVNCQLIHNLYEDSKYYHVTGNLLQLWLFICSHLQRTRLQNIQNLSKADRRKINISCVTALKARWTYALLRN